MDASFQLGLELTNALNPLGQAVSALKSLGIIEAIKKSGSDAITELRLASFIGRHRIDEAIKIHFREAVAKSGQSTISQYIDIVLEAGAGPTVQQALKNPALFSMVIQLSALAFSHEDESLANAIVEATERIAERSKRDADIVPDYVSLLGTVRACRQQTASFHWANLYEAVERKILSALTKVEEDGSESTNSDKMYEISIVPNTKLQSVTNRRLPFKVLESLLVGLLSLQSLEENRILHIKSDSGISTIVVWCYHVLGIGVSFRCQNVEVNFGDEPRNLILETIAAEDACAIMMDPADPHEPLFTLHADEDDPVLSYEYRFQAFGFGSRVLLQASLGDAEFHRAELHRTWSHWIIACCLIRVRNLLPSSEADKLRDLTRNEDTNGAISVSASKMPSEATIMNAAKFTFALDSVDADLVKKYTNSPLTTPAGGPWFNWPALVALVFAITRVHPNDLEGCGNLPLSLPAFEYLDQTHHGIKKSTKDQTEAIMTIPTSFDILCRLMLGNSFSHGYIEHAVLVSAGGWSMFFGTIGALDPADVSACDIRLLQGVPARKGLRRSRIIDGPNSHIDLTVGLEIDKKYGVNFFPGISSSKRGEVLVGHQSDAFSVSQSFEWIPEKVSYFPFGHAEPSKRKLKMGFRKMLELCADARTLSPCECDSNVQGSAQYIKNIFQPPCLKNHVKNVRLVAEKHILNLNREWPKPEIIRKLYLTPSEGSVNELQEIVLTSQLEETLDTVSGDFTKVSGRSRRSRTWIYYVSGNPTARWMQLIHMYSSGGPSDRFKPFKTIIRGRTTCIECACKSPLLWELGETHVLL